MNIIKTILTVSTILVLTVLFSCNTNEKTSNEIIIKGSFQEFENIRVIIKSTSPFLPIADTVDVDAQGKFSYNTTSEKPLYFKIKFAGRRPNLDFYARPGDSIIFTANSVGKIMKTIKFSGNAPIYNDYLIRTNAIISNFNSNIMKTMGKEEKAAMYSLDSIRALYADEIAALQKGNTNIDPYFIKIESARALYQWAILHRLYPDYYNYIHKNKEGVGIKTSPEFDTYLAEIELNNEELIDLPIYTEFIKTYLQKNYNKFYDDKSEEQHGSFANFQLSTIKKDIKSPVIASILAYKAVNDQVTYEGTNDKDLYWANFIKLCNNEAFLNDITNKLEKWKHLEKGKPIKEIKMTDINGKPVHFADFKGKWIYIDIWATWCSPCLAEVPVLKELEEQFRGQNVVFMSISVDRKPESWKAMVADKELKGVQVWAGQNDVITNHYKVSGIPRFMIFDPQGNVYTANAKRPSTGIEAVITDLLK